ncbi:MAG: RNA-guided endonuclease IscB [Actinomycetota bacterium]|nr:RNA-guided endonuclease IscB [Actinomycetota bacterium]
MPCHPARARELLRKGRARVHRAVPLVIRLIDRTVEDSQVNGVQIGIDPGSRHTGLAVFGFGDKTADARRGLFSVQLDHRGQRIKKAMAGRAQLRRSRRSRNLRYRAPRFNNRARPKGWLAPSLRHRVDTTMSWVDRLQRWFPVVGVHQELVRFDMQKLQNPEVAGIEYQHGTLHGFEVREYLLEKWKRQCAYCGATGTGADSVPLNLDHIHARAKGGSNRVSNLVLACIPCNQAKGSRSAAEFLAGKPARLALILAQAKRPLADAAAVNTTRRALYRALVDIGLPVATGSGGQTKYNRTQAGLPKSHTLDALAVGQITGIASVADRVHLAVSAGRGRYQRTGADKYGFPTRTFTSAKQHFGFATGDLVRAVVPTGIKAGIHTGRVAVRASGSFNITTDTALLQGIHHRHIQLRQRADGYLHQQREEASAQV